MTVKYSGEGIRDNTDETKVMSFDVSGVTTNTTRTLTMPDRNVTIGDAGDLTGNLPAIDGSSLTNLPAGGKVLQVLQSGITNDPSTTSSSYVDTGLQVDITPSSTSSKVLIILVGHGIKYTGSNANSMNTRIERDGTVIVNQHGLFWSNSNTYHTGGISMSELDSPATTNQVTYKFRFATTNSGNTVALRGGDASMIAMEIAA